MMPSHASIFHINTESSIRGGEIQTIHLIEGLHQREYRNLLIVQKGSPLLERAKQASIQTIEMKMRGEWDLPAVMKMRKLIREHSPDLLHAHTAHALSLVIMAVLGNNHVAVVGTRRVTLPISGNLLARFKYNSSDGIIAVSNAVRNQLIENGIQQEKIFIAESGTEFSRLDRAIPRKECRDKLGIPENSFVIGNVSHFDQNKGQNHLIDAFIQFAGSHPENQCYLVLVGDGPELERCREKANRSAFGDRIVFTGKRFDVENLYPAMDIFFLSSLRGEGWSGVLREAMGVGLPSIAVDQTATREQLQNARIGLLVSDRISEWVDAIEKLFTNPELQRKYGQLGKDAARQFTVDTMVEKTITCYNAVLSQRSSPDAKRNDISKPKSKS